VQTDLSVIEFAVDKVTRQHVILKTVHSKELAEMEVEMLNLVNQHNIPYTVRLLDAFVDTSEDELPASIPMQTPPPSLPSSMSSSSFTPSIHRTLLQRTVSEASGLGMSQSYNQCLHGASPGSSHSDSHSIGDRRIHSDRCVLVFEQLVKPELKHLDLVDVARTFKQLCLALSALSKVKPTPIAHLDVCTNNIMMNPKTKQIVLIDFGLARPAHRASIHPEGRGTAGFVAPEMYVGRGQGTIPDAYSAGVVFGCLLEQYVPGCDLNYLGSRLVRHPTTTFIQSKLQELVNNRDHPIPEVVYYAADLLAKLLEVEPGDRISCERALEHPFLTAKPAEFVGTTWKEWQERQTELKRSASSRRLAVRVSYRG
jgi:serine/threonine protein kinase